MPKTVDIVQFPTDEKSVGNLKKQVCNLKFTKTSKILVFICDYDYACFFFYLGKARSQPRVAKISMQSWLIICFSFGIIIVYCGF